MNNPFQKRRRQGPILSPEEGKRQGHAVRAAQALGDVEAVRAFLNSPHETLGGRPIDLAVASAAGLAAVEAEIAAERGRRNGGAPSPSAQELSR
ncbi:MAG TPA: antitoxin Xre/MbcA/ParS toxin-binding domain-containing protein [Allosphingosinicella sp.]|nr:antitoxin Xre/MbcA/ParS toxin-binding domain-containing protein [Allosphingosinicella sp.]